MTKIQFDKEVTVVIGNVCNLTCNNCMTFGDRKFKGWFKWEDYAGIYRKWQEIVDFHDITIVGGEPYANPTLLTWARELVNLWPSSKFYIDTNGVLLKQKIELTRELINLGFCIRITYHDPAHLDEINNSINEILTIYDGIEKKEYIDYYNLKAIDYKYKEKTLIKISDHTRFFPNPVKEIINKVTYFYKGDPETVHKNCPVNQDFMLLHGIIYKCVFSAAYKEARLQFNFEDRANKLIDEYTGCSPFENIETVKLFIENLINYMPLCEICPYDTTIAPPYTERPIILYPMNKIKKDY
jgi:uncharacterized Fe-S cluster-containing radical SAM superfamily protein